MRKLGAKLSFEAVGWFDRPIPVRPAKRGLACAAGGVSTKVRIRIVIHRGSNRAALKWRKKFEGQGYVVEIVRRIGSTEH